MATVIKFKCPKCKGEEFGTLANSTEVLNQCRGFLYGPVRQASDKWDLVERRSCDFEWRPSENSAVMVAEVSFTSDRAYELAIKAIQASKTLRLLMGV